MPLSSKFFTEPTGKRNCKNLSKFSEDMEKVQHCKNEVFRMHFFGGYSVATSFGISKHR